MSWLKSQTFGAHVALALVAGFVVGVSAEVLADTVYTWTTDDGTVSFTDDEKHVPARYRDRMQMKVMEGLDGYYRYTPVDVAAGPPPDSATASTPAPAGAPGVVVVPQSGLSVMTGGSRYGGGGMIVPIDSAPTDEPMVVEQRRVKRDDSMATSHEIVIRQGDRIIAVQRNEPSQRDGTKMVPPTDD
jgi:hypothetical protein